MDSTDPTAQIFNIVASVQRVGYTSLSNYTGGAGWHQTPGRAIR
ncbi:hypothetical protein ACFUEJ_22350 [Gordonia sp. NPDC057258]